MGHNKGHLARAVMEGVAFHIRWICEVMEQLGLSLGDIRAIGGGSSSPTWTQIISDVTGRELQVVARPLEAGAIGAALTVAVGMGVYPNMDAADELIEVSHSVQPREENQTRYDALYREYRALYDALSPLYHRLRSVS